LDKVIVTGASRGIGKTIAEVLSKNGYYVIAISRDIDSLNKNFKENDNVEIYQLDITNNEDVDKFAKYLDGVPIKALINNAGGPGKHSNYFKDQWINSYELNVIAQLYMTQMMYKNLLSKEGSCVIMITSEAGHYYESQVGDYYSISKAGSAFLAKALCQRLSNLGIRFTELSPSTVQTKEFDEKHGFNTIKAEDIAECVRWIISMPPHVNFNEIHITPLNKVDRSTSANYLFGI
jgi:NADP-dependent 3-hydroxy acid dehydrogenase YdfG